MELLTREQRARRARALQESLDARGVDALALVFVDNAGIARTKTVPTGRLCEVVSTGVGMSPVFDYFGVDDGIAPEGGPVGDVRLVPDIDRITPLAAQPGWAWAPVDRRRQDGTEHAGCQRAFAARVSRAAADRALAVQMGFEVEWVVGGEDAEGAFVPACLGPAYGMTRLVELSDYVADLHRALAAEGVDVLQIHPEYAPGQFECSVAPEDPVGAADTVLLVRETIRAVTHRRGMRPSFAPVVATGGVGNGCHLHLSLWRDGRNLFSHGEGPHGLTKEAESFLSGVLAQLPALVGVGAPSAASYLRLVPSQWAGAYQCWGWENREAAMRLVVGAHGEEERANLEIKCFDGAANPYLVVGAVLAVGLAGIDDGGSLPEEMEVDPASMSDEERARLGVTRLPQSLGEAIDHLSACRALGGAMGRELLDAVLAVRRAERSLFSGSTSEEIVAATRWRY